MLDVELWAEIRRLKHVEGLSQREIHRRTGVHRDTIRNALASATPPVYGPRPPRPSKLEPFVAVIEELLADEPTLSGVRVREELERIGYGGGKTILDELLREFARILFQRLGQLRAHALQHLHFGEQRIENVGPHIYMG